MKIVGISAFYHDSAAALIVDGRIVAAAQEERFSRKKFDPAFPVASLQFCLRKANLQLSDVDEIVYYEKPLLSLERLIESIIATAPKSYFAFLAAMPIWIREKLNTKATLIKHLGKNFPDQKIPKITFSEHHLSHAASAFYPSPFNSAAVLCLDGVGEWACGSGWRAAGSQLTPLWEMHFPHSLGLLYSAFTWFCGFKVNSGEYKLMGLAPFGKPIYVDLIKTNLLDLKDDGSFRLNMKYFSFASELKMVNQNFYELFKLKPRTPEGPMPQGYKDLAASIQKVAEEIILKLARTLKKQTGEENLCLAGGVALNCVANGLLLKENIFKNIWIQPAAGDAGNALGAALASYYQNHQRKRTPVADDSMSGSYLGPSYSDDEILEFLKTTKANFSKLKSSDLEAVAAYDLANQKVIGWFQGAMEYGPRSLGGRSILADARGADMQSRVNLKIKYRESFRPFAPIILNEEMHEVYEADFESPYMLLVTHVKKEKKNDYPAVTHVDGSARVQTVSASRNPQIYALLKEFYLKTGSPVLINTSFNQRGEPIVCSPEDALRCFIQTDMDSLFLGSFYLKKEDQKFKRNESRWKMKHELD